MKKRMIGFCCIMLVAMLSITLSGCKKGGAVEKYFPETVTKMKSYKLVARLETMFPTGTKECEITVFYKQPDMYRVEIKNPNVNETQIMIKNGDGTFILIPSIHKSFKVNSSWPTNSSYPYLLQSLSKDIVSDDKMIVTKDKDTTTLELKAKIFDDAAPTKQKILFDNKTGLPTEVLVYDSNHNLLSRLTFKSIEVDVKIDNKQFMVDDTMQTARVIYEENPLTFERSISYPTYYPTGTTLQEEVIKGDSNNKNVIMKFSGGATFTIIEQYVNDTEAMKTEYLDGDIYIMGGVIGIISGKTVMFYENGMEYILASKTVECVELIKMAESLRITDNK